jgi:hypothetical protein
MFSIYSDIQQMSVWERTLETSPIILAFLNVIIAMVALLGPWTTDIDLNGLTQTLYTLDNGIEDKTKAGTAISMRTTATLTLLGSIIILLTEGWTTMTNNASGKPTLGLRKVIAVYLFQLACAVATLWLFGVDSAKLLTDQSLKRGGIGQFATIYLLVFAFLRASYLIFFDLNNIKTLVGKAWLVFVTNGVILVAFANVFVAMLALLGPWTSATVTDNRGYRETLFTLQNDVQDDDALVNKVMAMRWAAGITLGATLVVLFAETIGRTGGDSKTSALGLTRGVLVYMILFLGALTTLSIFAVNVKKLLKDESSSVADVFTVAAGSMSMTYITVFAFLRTCYLLFFWVTKYQDNVRRAYSKIGVDSNLGSIF